MKLLTSHIWTYTDRVSQVLTYVDQPPILEHSRIWLEGSLMLLEVFAAGYFFICHEKLKIQPCFLTQHLHIFQFTCVNVLLKTVQWEGEN